MMNDQELIERLREGKAEYFVQTFAADRIEELVKERDEARIAINQIGEAMGVLGIVQCLGDIVAEAKKRFAKLAKAVEALKFYAPQTVGGITFVGGDDAGKRASAALAELEKM